VTGWFNHLPGFQKTPYGTERVLLRRLPRITLLGTALLLLPSVLVRAAIWLDWMAEGAHMPGMVDIYVISLVVLHWTVVFTAAIGAFIVMVMKGPAYVADPYPLPKAPSADNGDT